MVGCPRGRWCLAWGWGCSGWCWNPVGYPTYSVVLDILKINSSATGQSLFVLFISKNPDWCTWKHTKTNKQTTHKNQNVHCPFQIWNYSHVTWSSQTLLASGLSNLSHQGGLSIEVLVTGAVSGHSQVRLRMTDRHSPQKTSRSPASNSYLQFLPHPNYVQYGWRRGKFGRSEYHLILCILLTFWWKHSWRRLHFSRWTQKNKKGAGSQCYLLAAWESTPCTWSLFGAAMPCCDWKETQRVIRSAFTEHLLYARSSSRHTENSMISIRVSVFWERSVCVGWGRQVNTGRQFQFHMSKSLGIAQGIVAELKAELSSFGFRLFQRKHLFTR